MAALHPKGVNHLALTTTNMKAQLEFWCDVLGCSLRALYWMHGVEGTYHGFVELSSDSYVAFVQHPDNTEKFVPGLTHAGNPGGPAPGGTMQHVAFHVDDFNQLLALRDRIRNRGVRVMGPINHGFVQSIYFAGPEGLALEIATGSDIPADQWIDPEVQALCGITDDELERLKEPVDYESGDDWLSNPPHDSGRPEMWFPNGGAEIIYSMSDQTVWDRMSEPEPPVPPA